MTRAHAVTGRAAVGALGLGVALTGCGVETVEGEIADQQPCAAAADPSTGSTALRELSARAQDPELARSLADAAAGRDVAADLARVCQRLSAS